MNYERLKQELFETEYERLKQELFEAEHKAKNVADSIATPETQVNSEAFDILIGSLQKVKKIKKEIENINSGKFMNDFDQYTHLIPSILVSENKKKFRRNAIMCIVSVISVYLAFVYFSINFWFG